MDCTYPTPCNSMCASLLSAVHINGKTARGKNMPELLTMPVSAVGRSVATSLPSGSVKVPLVESKALVSTSVVAMAS